MLAIWLGVVAAIVSLMFLRKDDKAVAQLKHKQSLEDAELQKLHERRRIESTKYSSSEKP
jgi:hypothetical protein